MIVMIDYGMGNLRSLKNAFEYLGHDVEISRDPTMVDSADRVLLPGVGAFGDAMKAIRDLDLEPLLHRQALELRKPVLGICLGMQLMAKESFEHGHHQGLGWFDASVQRLPNSPTAKVPQVGWNTLRILREEWLFEGIPTANDFYFVHSYHAVCANPDDVVATTDHDGPTTAVMARDNIVAAQFHPEKSQDNGLQFLQNWLDRDFS